MSRADTPLNEDRVEWLPPVMRNLVAPQYASVRTSRSAGPGRGLRGRPGHCLALPQVVLGHTVTKSPRTARPSLDSGAWPAEGQGREDTPRAAVGAR